MTVFSFAFYMFAVITVTAGLMVTLSRNPVHSVLWLILAFLSTSKQGDGNSPDSIAPSGRPSAMKRCTVIGSAFLSSLRQSFNSHWRISPTKPVRFGICAHQGMSADLKEFGRTMAWS